MPHNSLSSRITQAVHWSTGNPCETLHDHLTKRFTRNVISFLLQANWKVNVPWRDLSAELMKNLWPTDRLAHSRGVWPSAARKLAGFAHLSHSFIQLCSSCNGLGIWNAPKHLKAGWSAYLAGRIYPYSYGYCHSDVYDEHKKR